MVYAKFLFKYSYLIFLDLGKWNKLLEWGKRKLFSVSEWGKHLERGLKLVRWTI